MRLTQRGIIICLSTRTSTGAEIHTIGPLHNLVIRHRLAHGDLDDMHRNLIFVLRAGGT